jgi:hypothetical protein
LATAALSQQQDQTQLSVRVIAIDDAISNAQLPVPDLVKIDVEGGELNVLRGMEQTLARAQPVLLCEIHNDVGKSQRLELVRLLEDYGYQVSNLERERGGMPHIIARPSPARENA